MILHNFKWSECFDENYFENGLESGTSLYENYRWLPEISLPIACHLKTLFPDKSILDFGCAKGFLVKALRMLNVEAYGFDVSCYAIQNADSKTKPFIYCPDDKFLPYVDVIFAKDTFEHIGENDIVPVLNCLKKICHEILIIVPFGDNGKYRIDEYEKDATHIIRCNEAWWKRQFNVAHLKIHKFCYQMAGFKDNWSHYRYGNGFFYLTT